MRALSVSRDPTRPFATRPDRTLLVLRQAEVALSGQGRCVPRRLVRVPMDAIVQVRSKGPLLLAVPQQPVLRLAAPRRGDAAVAPPPSPSRAGLGKAAYVLREAVTLALFVATLAATYYLGRTHAFQNVIVVPEPWSRHSTLS